LGTKYDAVTPWQNCIELAESIPQKHQVYLKDFFGLHTGEFHLWHLFDEFIQETTKQQREGKDITEADIIECISNLIVEDETK